MLATMTDSAPAATAPAGGLPERMLSDHDVSKFFGVGVATVRRWLKAGLLPAPLVIENRRYWDPNVLIKIIRPS